MVPSGSSIKTRSGILISMSQLPMDIYGGDGCIIMWIG